MCNCYSSNRLEVCKHKIQIVWRFSEYLQNKTINKIHNPDICYSRSISGDEASARFADEDSLDEDSIEEQEAPGDYVKGEENEIFFLF